MSLLRKKAPGPCAACGKAPAAFRCPACRRELCEDCVRAAAESLTEEEGGPHLRIAFVTDAGETEEKRGRAAARLHAQREEMRRTVREGGGICLGCSIRKRKAVALKRI